MSRKDASWLPPGEKGKIQFVDTDSTVPFAMFEHYISETTAKWQNIRRMRRPWPLSAWERRVQFITEDDQ